VPSIFPDCYRKRKADDTRRFSRLQQRKRLENYKDIEAGENLPEIEDVRPPVVDKQFKDKCIQASNVYKCETFVFSVERFENSVSTQVNIYFNTGASRISKPSRDAETFTDERELINGFYGFKSINDEKQLSSICGVSYAIFHTILNLLSATKTKMSKENRLLLFFMKLKLGLSYAALGVLFQVHSTTASSIFKQITKEIAQRTRGLIFWPSRFFL
ncbi:uncharacterized protein LOC120354355, partial [Nilaparvata lugens]|uniref:uncharacterized protein LOC120354355 n=1 Tax=Nilaparvata lugens TaxID=108931 RepID=UPI00193DA2DA